MANDNHLPEPAADLAGLPDSIQREITAFRSVRPFLMRCFSLNHDINNPLAGIIGYAEVLVEDGEPLTDEQRVGLGHILQCAERIRSLVNQLSEEKARLMADDLLDSLGPPAG